MDLHWSSAPACELATAPAHPPPPSGHRRPAGGPSPPRGSLPRGVGGRSRVRVATIEPGRTTLERRPGPPHRPGREDAKPGRAASHRRAPRRLPALARRPRPPARGRRRRPRPGAGSSCHLPAARPRRRSPPALLGSALPSAPLPAGPAGAAANAYPAGNRPSAPVAICPLLSRQQASPLPFPVPRAAGHANGSRR